MSKTKKDPTAPAEPKVTKCAINRATFNEGAKPLIVEVDGRKMALSPREFSTGSLGWFANEKSMIEVGGEPVKVQIQVNVTVVGSKDLPKD